MSVGAHISRVLCKPCLYRHLCLTNLRRVSMCQSMLGTCRRSFSSTEDLASNRGRLEPNDTDTELIKQTKEQRRKKLDDEEVTKENLERKVNEAMTVYYEPTKFDKTVLLWAGKYPSMEDIPRHVELSTMLSARDKIRTLTSLWLLVGSILACFIIIKIGQSKYDKHLDDKYKENVKMWVDLGLVDEKKAEEMKRSNK